jgi:hypothetical protein
LLHRGDVGVVTDPGDDRVGRGQRLARPPQPGDLLPTGPAPLAQQIERPQRTRQAHRVGVAPQRGQRVQAHPVGQRDEARAVARRTACLHQHRCGGRGDLGARTRRRPAGGVDHVGEVGEQRRPMRPGALLGHHITSRRARTDPRYGPRPGDGANAAGHRRPGQQVP